MAGYTLTLFTPYGDALGTLTEYASLNYNRKLNTVGVCTVVVTPNINPDVLAVDTILIITRTIGAFSYIDGNCLWYLRDWNTGNDTGEELTTLTFYDACTLLTRRIIPASSADVEAKKIDVADDMMRELVDENLGASASAARTISSYLTVEADTSIGPILSIQVSERNLFETLTEIANSSKEEGTPIYFDVIRTGILTSEFRVFANRLGTDHGLLSGNVVIVSQTNGTLVKPHLSFDFSAMSNYIYAGGKGEGTDRPVVQVMDPDSILLSPINRIEEFYNSNNTDDRIVLLDEAGHFIQSRKGKISLTGNIQDTDNFRYGIDYNYGDTVVGSYRGYNMDSLVDSVVISFTAGQETITCQILGEKYV